MEALGKILLDGVIQVLSNDETNQVEEAFSAVVARFDIAILQGQNESFSKRIPVSHWNHTLIIIFSKWSQKLLLINGNTFLYALYTSS